MVGFFISKQFQLLTGQGGFCFLFAVIDFNVAKLLVGNAQNTYVAFARKQTPDPFDVYVSILTTGAMSDIN